jgi:metal-responsive CopG/Arc/MetJ family transcriptional regulator
MRTTIELRDDQRESLAALAARRGMRGYSVLVQEAVDQFLRRREDRALDTVLGLEGALTDEEARDLETAVAEIRSEAWRSFS